GFYRPASPPAPGSTMTNSVTAFAPDFKMPRTWKSSLAVDIKMPWGVIGTVEAIYNRDVKVIYSKNINLVNPSPLSVAAYPWDNRMIYPVTANGANNINRLSNPSPGVLVPSASGTQSLTMIMSGNEKKGHYASLAIKLEKPFKNGFAASVAYTKTVANNLFDGLGDQPFNLWSLVQTVNGANTPQLSHAVYTVPDRVIGTLSYRKEYLKHLVTTIALVYQGSIDYRFSYVYGADFNRDGVNGNDLIWIPTAAQVQQMTFVSHNQNGIIYDQAAQRTLFENYVQQDKYLRTHRGQYAERNGAQSPWRNQLNVKFMQDLFVMAGKTRNTLQFTVDIINAGNLINRSWGKGKQANAAAFFAGNASILLPQNQTALVPGGAVVPTFKLQTDRGQMITRTFRDDVSTFSTYAIQLGLRYIFNN
ncbi:MAG TPA: hypothetical protein VMZ03_02620, partial [Chitinophagaceae bacterium]|nr:hypothetical protein [Chitinophagaceae bacterium]